MKYHITAVLSCLVFSMGVIALADEPTDDPINAKLALARSSFVKDVKKFNEEFEKAIESKIAEARKSGKQEVVDGLKAELDAFNNEGAIPSKTPPALRRKRTVMRGKMEEAFETAIKGYTKSGNDVERKKIEEEFQRPEIIAEIKKVLVGTWKAKIGNWNTSFVFNENGKVLLTTDKVTDGYTINPDKGTVTFNNGSTTLKLPLDPKGTTVNNTRGEEFVIVKEK